MFTNMTSTVKFVGDLHYLLVQSQVQCLFSPNRICSGQTKVEDFLEQLRTHPIHSNPGWSEFSHL